MNVSIRLPILAALLAVAGCSTTSYCEGEHDYQTAPSIPPLRSTEGVKLPESASALRIPPPPPNNVPYAEPYKDEDGDDAFRCLDKPPPMPAIAAEPAKAAPAPAPVTPPPSEPPPDVPPPPKQQ